MNNKEIYDAIEFADNSLRNLEFEKTASEGNKEALFWIENEIDYIKHERAELVKLLLTNI